MSASKNYRWRIAGFYFFYYAFVGMFSPYWSLYLKSIHFDAIEISVLMSIQPVMRMVATNVWGWLADHTGKRLLVVQVAASLSALFYLGMFVATGFWAVFLVMALMNFFWSASMPLVEATTLTYLGKNTAHYGRIRSWGSIGFIVSVVGLGYAFDYVAIAWLLWAGLVCEVGILIFARQIPKTEVLAHHTDHQPIKQIVLQPRVLALFGASFLMAVAHGPYYTFYSIYLVEHGYAKSVVGALWALGVICEIGVFFLMPALVRRFGFPRILLASFAAAVLRFLLIGWAVDWMVLVLFAQMLHAMTFGSFHAASLGMVHEFFQGRHQSRGQALFGSLTYGAGGMLGGLASGPIWKNWGASALYSFSAAAALLGLVLMWWKLRHMARGQAAAA
ncbi:putative 3-phenylpropionic acid transporter [Sideroxyarcus emersonii]|uniref:3-phenylpropionic acid transporter n=1 Tax=Sideroxyarcus emersonii TaxID=2764705 RepID=A0AAN1XBH2_9PROT|nr:MFS transporter [Sideroxyarcus emersonii]BCK88082.1 putative 3-phenylpropionic acid transporter [Sideroxyarcus emersonii]